MNASKDKYLTASSMPSTLNSVLQHCLVKLNGGLNDAAIRDAGGPLDDISKQVAASLPALLPAAQTKAADAVKFARGTIHTVIDDLNIISIAPVGVLDWAEIGPSGNGIRGSRLGPGGGIRVELASYVNFTVGYAFNINCQPGEGKGAVFFSLGIRDILH